MPGRDGGECIAGDTKIQFFDRQVEPLAIKDIKVLWEFSYDSDSSEMAESPKDVKPLSSVGQDGNVDTMAVFPIFRVAGDEHHPLVKIIVKGNSDGEEFALEATEWHPVAVNSQKFVPVCLLREDDQVLTVKGFGKVVGKRFLPMDKNNPTKVYSLALGDEHVLNDYASYIKEVKKARRQLSSMLKLGQKDLDDQLVELQERSNERLAGRRANAQNGFLGLEPRQHMIYTNGIASGSYSLQFQLIKFFRMGIQFANLPHVAFSG